MLLIARRQSDDVLREAGHFVDLFFNRQTGAQVVKFHVARGLGEDREGKGIPFGEDLAVGDVFAVLHTEARAVNDMVAFLFAALLIDDGDEARAVHGDGGAAAALNVLEIHELDDAVIARLESGTLGNARGGSTADGGTRGGWWAGTADRLSRD